MSLWPLNGDKPFTWSNSERQGDAIHSAHFALDDRSVLVGINDRIYRVSAGKMLPVYRAQPVAGGPPVKPVKQMPEGIVEKGESVFIDNIVPLADGRIAFAVVELRWEEREL